MTPARRLTFEPRAILASLERSGAGYIIIGEVKVVLAPAGVPRGFVALRGAASKENLGHGLQPYVAAVGDLAAMAAALHRPHDIARLPDLRRIMELEVDREQTISPPVEPSLRTASRGPRRGRHLAP
jgi:hypothetical protein